MATLNFLDLNKSVRIHTIKLKKIFTHLNLIKVYRKMFNLRIENNINKHVSNIGEGGVR